MVAPDLDVLVVDDDLVTRRLVCRLLQNLGAQRVRKAADGQEALEELKRKKADLVITDWGMPRLNGLGLLRAIRRDDQLKDLPVLMLTARSEKDYVLAAVQEGVSHYIVKPVTAKTLAEKLDKIFAFSSDPRPTLSV